MDIHEAKILLSLDRLGRVAIVARKDGRFCLYQHWNWAIETQHDAGVKPAQDIRWTVGCEAALYEDVNPLPGIYGSVDDAEIEARRLRGLNVG